MAASEELWEESGFDPRHLGDVEKCDLALRRKLLLLRLTTGKSFKVLEREADVPTLFGYDRRGFVAQTVFRYYGLVEQDRVYWRQQPLADAEAVVDQLLGDEELTRLRSGLTATATAKKPADAEQALDNLVAELRKIPPDKTESSTKQKSRVYTETLRLVMLQVYRGCCAFCETRESSQLRVSHLAPWAKKPEWRLDAQNAVLACRAHDGLIDSGLITMADDFSIVVSPLLDLGQNVALAQLIKTAVFRAPTNHGPAAQCLAYHRTLVFKTPAPAKKVAAAKMGKTGKKTAQPKVATTKKPQ